MTYYILGLMEKASAAYARTYLGLVWGHMSIQPGGVHFTPPIFGVWKPLFSYQTQVVNGLTANAAAGTLTVPAAGHYKVSISVSALVGNGDEWEFQVGINGVESELVSAHSAGYNPPKNTTGAGFGIITLAKNDAVSIRIRNNDSNTMTIEHAALIVEAI